jgi:PmbA protein
MNDMTDPTRLTDMVTSLVEAARRAGAEAADAVALRSRSRGVTVRLGKVESTEAAEQDDIALRVFVGQRTASVAATAGFCPDALAERAVAMARVSPEDPFQGLLESSSLVKSPRDLDLLDTSEIETEQLLADARTMEEAALEVAGVTRSGGATATTGMGGIVLATSEGFLGHYTRSRFSRSVSAIAGEGTAMERDYEFSVRLHRADLNAPEEIGRVAAERAVRRLDARKASTGPATVIYDPRVARGLAGHLAGAINGAAVARKTSFLRDRMGREVAASAISVTDDPLRPRGLASRPFDGEGMEGGALTMVDKGVLCHWFLSHSTARELGLRTNGRGSRAASSVTPASTNLAIEPGETSAEDLIASVKSGFYVTEVFGQGVNMVTGEYSRGASGFWIENGELAYPVSEITIAANLKDMFMNMVPANDLDRDYPTAAPTLLVEGMTIAGA